MTVPESHPPTAHDVVLYCDGLGIYSTGDHCPCTTGEGSLVEPGYPEPCCWCGWGNPAGSESARRDRRARAVPANPRRER